jgi:hypothetical protein
MIIFDGPGDPQMCLGKPNNSRPSSSPAWVRAAAAPRPADRPGVKNSEGIIVSETNTHKTWCL